MTVIPDYEADKRFRRAFWLWFARVATVIGLLAGGLALYDYLTEGQYTIKYEQKLSPEAMESLGRGETIEKGIIITPEENNDE